MTLDGSYVDSSDCELYFEDDPRATAFLEADTLEWYLKRATKIIDALPLKGHTYYYIDNTDPDSDEQERQFPRVISEIAVDWSDDTSAAVVPQAVKDACCEEALALYEMYVSSPGDAKRRKLQDQGVTSFSVGKLSETYGTVKASAKWKGLHSQEAYDFMKEYIAGAVRAIP